MNRLLSPVSKKPQQNKTKAFCLQELQPSVLNKTGFQKLQLSVHLMHTSLSDYNKLCVLGNFPRSHPTCRPTLGCSNIWDRRHKYLSFNFLLCTQCKSPLNKTLSWYTGSFPPAVGPTQSGMLLSASNITICQVISGAYLPPWWNFKPWKSRIILYSIHNLSIMASQVLSI